MSRIPLVLISGFLGSGKTTCLRALMEALKERKVGFSVVVNDFENAEVDAARLRTLDAEVLAINGSCVCCSSLNEFMQALGDIDVPPGSVLLVEANGASDLISLIAAITVRHECRRFTSPVQVTMVDASRWQNRGQHNELEREQVQTSTHWQMTHLHEVPATRQDSIRAQVRRLSPNGLETCIERFADFLQRLVVIRRFSPEAQQKTEIFDQALFAAGHAPDHHHHHDADRAFTSMRVDLPFVVHRHDLERTLQALPESVVRVKGLCRFADLPQIPFSFQHVRPKAETWFLPMVHVQGIIPTGVVIGVGLPASAIQAQFETMPSAELLPELKVAS